MQQLCDQHGQIRTILARLVTITQGAAPTDSGEFAQLRLAFSRALTAHFDAEDQALGKILWSKSGVPSPLLNDWAARRQELRVRYSQHLRDWPLAAALDNWTAYRKAVLEAQKAAEAFMRFEESEIYRLVR